MTTRTRKLHEVVAVAKGVKKRNYDEAGRLDKLAQKTDYFNGFTRKFQALSDDSAEKYPDESKKVQADVGTILHGYANHTKEAVDIDATLDRTNCVAFADVVLDDGTVVLAQVPAVTLLDLEKVLTDWRTFTQNLPTLDPAEEWEAIDGSPLRRTKPIVTHKTAKVEEVLVLAAATQHHPAQAKTITKDVITGHWHMTKLSGAITQDEKLALWKRANTLLDAVKAARERANSTEVVELKVGENLFNYLLG